MRIPRRPTQLRTTLREHAGRDDAPVFVYRFPTPREEADLLFQAVEKIQGSPEAMAKLGGLNGADLAIEINRLAQAGEIVLERRSTALCALCDQQLVTVENLQIDGAPFDRERHLQDLPGDWKVEIGFEIERRLRSYLTEVEEGNSSSPSSSGAEPAATTSSTAVAASDA